MRINCLRISSRSGIISILAVLCGYIPTFLYCENATAQSVVISGSVADSATNAKLAYATIAVFDIRDSLVGGTLSDDRGKFTITADRQTAGRISISYTGYSGQTIAIRNYIGSSIKLGTVYLKPGVNNLGLVEINADVARIEHKFEKNIIRPARSTISSATSIYEVLRTLPGVAVDESDNIRYRGFSPAIYVNNTPSFMLYPNLESIPPDMIEKIELIDAGMRSGGEGKGGIVNIILKKQGSEGISGMASAKPSRTSIKRPGITSADNISNFLNLNYKRQKMIVVSNLAYRFSRNDWGYDMTRTFMNKAESDSLVQITSQKTKGHTNGFTESLGYVYQPDDNTRFTAALAADWNKQKSLTAGYLDESVISSLCTTNQHITLSDDEYKYPSTSASLSYWHQFDSTERYIESNLYFALSENQYTSHNTEDYEIFNMAATDSIYNYSVQSQMKDCQAIYFDFTYYKPITSSLRWNLSYLLDANLNQHNIVKAEANRVTLPMLAKNDNSNLVYQNLSWRIGKRIKKWKLDAGINVEAKYLKGYYIRATNDFDDTTQHIDKWYVKMLPSATIAYDLGQYQDLKIRFAMSSRYPQFEELLNYIYKYSSYDWQAGNPGLSPSDVYSVYLGYGYTRPKFSVSCDFYYSYSSNMSTVVSIPVSSLTWIRKPYNVAEKSSMGFNNTFWIRIGQFDFSIYNDISVVHFKVHLSDSLIATNIVLNEDKKKPLLDYSSNCQLTYKTGNFSTSGSFSYNSRRAEYNGYEKGSLRAGISATYSIEDDKLLVSAGVSNLLRNLWESGYHNTNFGIITDSELYGIYYRPMFNLSVKYNFRYGDRGTENVNGKR